MVTQIASWGSASQFEGTCTLQLPYTALSARFIFCRDFSGNTQLASVYSLSTNEEHFCHHILHCRPPQLISHFDIFQIGLPVSEWIIGGVAAGIMPNVCKRSERCPAGSQPKFLCYVPERWQPKLNNSQNCHYTRAMELFCPLSCGLFAHTTTTVSCPQCRGRGSNVAP